MKTLYVKKVGDGFRLLEKARGDEGEQALEVDEVANAGWYGWHKSYLEEDGVIRMKTSEERDADAAESLRRDKLKEAKDVRNAALQDTTVEVREGVVLRTRPQDFINFTVEIAALAPGEVTQWIEDDEFIHDVTREELRDVFNKGKVKARQIWKDYITLVSNI